MKLLSRQSAYGIQAMLQVAIMGAEDRFIPVRRVAQNLGISFHFLAKIVQILSQHGLLKSYRGPNGGVSLAMSATEVTIYDIVCALDGQDFFTGCLIGLPGCGEKKPCPFHDAWSRERDSIKRLLQTTTLAELAERIEREHSRLGVTSE